MVTDGHRTPFWVSGPLTFSFARRFWSLGHCRFLPHKFLGRKGPHFFIFLPHLGTGRLVARKSRACKCIFCNSLAGARKSDDDDDDDDDDDYSIIIIIIDEYVCLLSLMILIIDDDDDDDGDDGGG